MFTECAGQLVRQNLLRRFFCKYSYSENFLKGVKNYVCIFRAFRSAGRSDGSDSRFFDLVLQNRWALEDLSPDGFNKRSSEARTGC